jgi:hypothetical protein
MKVRSKKLFIKTCGEKTYYFQTQMEQLYYQIPAQMTAYYKKTIVQSKIAGIIRVFGRRTCVYGMPERQIGNPRFPHSEHSLLNFQQGVIANVKNP